MDQNLFDVLVFSDGSGYKDGYGGWAAYVCTPDRRWKTFRMGAIAGTTVDRAEMTAMLEGLEMAFWMARDLPQYQVNFGDMMGAPCDRPKVLVYTDRENMVLSCKGVYDRSNSPDLWRRFEHYERELALTVMHVERETDFPELQTCDLHASTGRIIAKNYAENCALPPWALTF